MGESEKLTQSAQDLCARITEMVQDTWRVHYRALALLEECKQLPFAIKASEFSEAFGGQIDEGARNIVCMLEGMHSEMLKGEVEYELNDGKN